MSLLAEFTEGEIPGQLADLARELEEIKNLLDNFESSKEQKHLKEAANKIRTTAPGMKTLGQEYTSDFERKIVKRCRDEMKALFERARTVDSTLIG